MQHNQIVTPQEQITGPSTPFMEWQVEETIECLLRQAVELGETHSAIMHQRTGKHTPFAHQATTAYSAIQIIRMLQEQIKELEKHSQ